jgi:ribosomal protein S18 acetylase RimI-like enzyme
VTQESQWTLTDGYALHLIPKEKFEKLYSVYRNEIFENQEQFFDLKQTLSDEERKKTKNLNTNMGHPVILRLGVFKDDTFVGWYVGYQQSAETFYLQNAGVLPQHRRHGLYTAMLKKMVEITVKIGFQKIYLCTLATNNTSIIAALKQDFVISSMEINDGFGVFIHLSYYPNMLRKKVVDYRVGFIKPDEEIKHLLKL